jgi:mono/diheme cytochrome c family protein
LLAIWFQYPLVAQTSHFFELSPFAALPSRREDEDEEAYEEPAHHCPKDHGNCAVCHGAAPGIPRSRNAENRCRESDRRGSE